MLFLSNNSGKLKYESSDFGLRAERSFTSIRIWSLPSHGGGAVNWFFWEFADLFSFSDPKTFFIGSFLLSLEGLPLPLLLLFPRVHFGGMTPKSGGFQELFSTKRTSENPWFFNFLKNIIQPIVLIKFFLKEINVFWLDRQITFKDRIWVHLQEGIFKHIEIHQRRKGIYVLSKALRAEIIDFKLVSLMVLSKHFQFFYKVKRHC